MARGRRPVRRSSSAQTPTRRVARSPVPRDDRPDISKRVDGLVAHIRKKFGPDSISRLGDSFEDVIGTFPTGFQSLDAAIGIGGFPLAKLVQISGPQSVGKSTLCKALIAQAQRHGITPYFIDGEMSKDTPERYGALDISTATVAWTEALFIEDAFQQAHAAIEWLKDEEDPALIFMDSIAAFQLKADVERKFEDEGRRAAKASFLSANLPKLIHALKGSKVGMVFVNQMRQTANAMPFQDPNYEPGGMALRHWCHLILRMKPFGQIKQGSDVIAVKSRVVVRKSKLAPPFKYADLAIYFDGRIEETTDD